MKRYYAVDRIEGNIAVLEADDRTRKEVDLAQLPVGLKEGDVLAWESGRYSVDQEQTKQRRDVARRLQQELFRPHKEE